MDFGDIRHVLQTIGAAMRALFTMAMFGLFALGLVHTSQTLTVAALQAPAPAIMLAAR